MNYNNMSDFEINLIVHCVLNPSINPVGAYEIEGATSPCDHYVSDIHSHYSHNYLPRYCSCPSQAHPVIFNNDIEISIGRHGGFKTGQYVAKGDWEREENNNYANVTAFHENPLRAAMICFLKMKDAEC